MFERDDDVLYVCYDNEALHEHRRPALERDAAGRAHGEHQAGRRGAGQRLRSGQERAADRDGARDPLRRDRDRRRAARPRGEGRARDGVLTARATCTCSCPARSAGDRACERHDPDRPAREGDRPLPGLRGRARRGRARLEDPPAGAGRGVPRACRTATPTSSATRRAPTSSPRCRRSPTATSRRFGLLEQEAA